MIDIPGRLIVLEGCDGVGKTTQQHLLVKNLERLGVSTATASYPSHSDLSFGRSVTQYLNGSFGPVDQVDPHLSGLLYAGDRYEQKHKLIKDLFDYGLVISSRYYPSTYVYQGARVPAERRESYWQWLESVEFGTFANHKADLVIYLDVPIETIAKRLSEKKAVDLHEVDISYQDSVRSLYRQFVKKSRHQMEEWHQVECGDRSEAEISEEILAIVKDFIGYDLGLYSAND
jgi:dTMP kinase